MLVNGSVQRRAEEVIAEVTVAQALYALCPPPDGRAAGEAQLSTAAHHTAKGGAELYACKRGTVGQGIPQIQPQYGGWSRRVGGGGGGGVCTHMTRIVLWSHVHTQTAHEVGNSAVGSGFFRLHLCCTTLQHARMASSVALADCNGICTLGACSQAIPMPCRAAKLDARLWRKYLPAAELLSVPGAVSS